jgi:hypothetical protein
LELTHRSVGDSYFRYLPCTEAKPMRPFPIMVDAERGNTMRGTGPVAINGAMVYAYYTTDSSSVRVRISVDETDRLNIIDGLRLRIALPGQETMDLLVVETNRNPPYVWLHLEPLTPLPQFRAGGTAIP